MPAIERKLDRKFSEVPGGYARNIDEHITLFIPKCCAASFDEKSGEVYGYAPDYEAIEAKKTPAIIADRPGVYSYCSEMQQAPIGCDFSAQFAYYGKHYFLRPLRNDLPKLHGRGITYNEEDGDYMITKSAYDKLKAQYKIMYEYWLD